MNNQGLTITTSVLRDSSSTIKREVEELKSALDTAKRIIMQTEESFRGTAADEIRNNFNSLSTKFNDFYQAITDYAKFLENTATAYDQAEGSIQKAADEVLTTGYDA